MITVVVIPSCPVGASTELSCLLLSVSTITVVLLESWLYFAMDVYTCNKKKNRFHTMRGLSTKVCYFE